MSHKIAPSILAADFNNLEKECKMVNSSLADWFHLDVMDGVFVPNISFGIPIIRDINKIASKPLDVHLMIVNPEKYISRFKEVGADILTVHFEACNHLHRTVHEIKEQGMKAGVAINPHTPINSLYEILEDLDLVCIMSVNPGFGGQSFINNTFKKVKELSSIKEKNNLKFLIEIDGGVNQKNSSHLLDVGANVLVAGSFVFKSKNPTKTIEELKKI